MTTSKRVAALVLVALVGGCGMVGDETATEAADPTQLAVIKAGELTYYPAGDYVRNGNPVSPAQRTVRFSHDFEIMKRQVSQAEYEQCVIAGACKKLDKAQRGAVAPNLPAVGISWRDATDYATWLSARTGRHYRLPSYAEWVYAAGSQYEEDVIVDVSDPNDPAQRWIMEYKLEAQRKSTVDGTPVPFGSFGSNAAGVSDMIGNVWDWTDTCHTRQHIDQTGAALLPPAENCGIRAVAGRHRSYISDFIRDPKGGACSVGVPPSNLGFRLVRDPSL